MESLETFWSSRDFFCFQIISKANPADNFPLIITDSNNWEFLNKEFYKKTLFIDNQQCFQYFYSLQFGDFLATPFNSKDLHYKLSGILKNIYIFPIEKIRYLFTAKEWKLCLQLSRQPNSIINYSALLKTLETTDRNKLTQYIYRIKDKLKHSQAGSYIHIRSIRNAGYQWINIFVNNLWITI